MEYLVENCCFHWEQLKKMDTIKIDLFEVFREPLQQPELKGQDTRERTSLAVQWLGLHDSTAGSMGSIPVGGTKIPHAARCGQREGKLTEVSPTFWKLLFSSWHLVTLGIDKEAETLVEAEKYHSSQQPYRSEEIKLGLWGSQISQDSRSQGSRKKRGTEKWGWQLMVFSLKYLVNLSHIKWKAKKPRKAAGK